MSGETQFPIANCQLPTIPNSQLPTIPNFNSVKPVGNWTLGVVGRWQLGVGRCLSRCSVRGADRWPLRRGETASRRGRRPVEPDQGGCDPRDCRCDGILSLRWLRHCATTRGSRFVRRAIPIPTARCVVYWMQRAQRAVDNPALDVAVAVGNALRLPVVVFFGLNPFIERANLRHYRFLVDGLPDIAAGLRRRRVGFVLRRYPHHRLLPFVGEVRPAIVIGDENPLRQTEAWRERSATSCACRSGRWTPTSSCRQAAAQGALRGAHDPAAAGGAARRVPGAVEGSGGGDALARATRCARRSSRPCGCSTGCRSTRRSAPSQTCVAEPARRGGAFGLRPPRTSMDTTAAAIIPRSGARASCRPICTSATSDRARSALAVRDSGGAPEAVAAFLEQLIVRRELAVNFVTFNRQIRSPRRLRALGPADTGRTSPRSAAVSLHRSTSSRPPTPTIRSGTPPSGRW